jgi:hypothetical protein
MAHRILRISVCSLLLSCSLLNAQLPQLPSIPGLGNKSSGAPGLDDTKIASGLKDALSVGTEKAVEQVAKPGGYLDDAAIKILLPKNLQTGEKFCERLGRDRRSMSSSRV